MVFQPRYVGQSWDDDLTNEFIIKLLNVICNVCFSTSTASSSSSSLSPTSHQVSGENGHQATTSFGQSDERGVDGQRTIEGEEIEKRKKVVEEVTKSQTIRINTWDLNNVYLYPGDCYFAASSFACPLDEMFSLGEPRGIRGSPHRPPILMAWTADRRHRSHKLSPKIIIVGVRVRSMGLRGTEKSGLLARPDQIHRAETIMEPAQDPAELIVLLLRNS